MTKSGIAQPFNLPPYVLPVLVVLLLCTLTFMVHDMIPTSSPTGVVEGFKDGANLRRLVNNKRNPKFKSFNSTHLKNYGFKSSEKFTDTDKKSGKNKAKAELITRVSKAHREGGVDNFQDVLDEIDQIDPSAFSAKSMSSTISRYNDNLNNRLNWAKKKHGDNRLDRTMAQGSVLWDEFKKIFMFTEVF